MRLDPLIHMISRLLKLIIVKLILLIDMFSGRIRVAIPNPSVGRRRPCTLLRTLLFLAFISFIWVQVYVANLGSDSAMSIEANESTAAVLSMVPKVGIHRYTT